MQFGRSLICLVALVLLYTRPGIAQTTINYKSLYAQAENLSNDANHTDKSDEAALKLYKQVVSYLTQTQAEDRFLFKADVSTGAFLQVLGEQQESISYFKKAIALKPALPALKDSVLFRPLVYCGNAFYTLDKLDSAEFFYKKASEIADRFPNVSELERLYNTLGVISYSKGNYSESIPFYQKAISTLQKTKQPDRSLLVVYQSNLASAFRKLKRYDEALNIYLQLLPYKIQTDQILHNIAATYLGMNEDDKAIVYLNRVSYEDQKKLNDLALAYVHKHDYNKALTYLTEAQRQNFVVHKTTKNSDYGITLKYWGDLYSEQKQTQKALSCYQQALTNLLADFNPDNVYINPTDFKSAFNGIDILGVLSAKANAFKLQYQQSRQMRDLEASLDTYTAFCALADYMARFYETDESRAVISSRKYLSRDEPISICLQLFDLTHDKSFVEKAFALDEENKAGILSLYLDEATRKQKTAPPQLLSNERRLKESITRISLRASAAPNGPKLAAEREEINELTVKLVRIQQKISEKTGFTNIGGPKIAIKELQKAIPSNGVALSYHVSNKGLICFVVTRNDFDFFKVPIDSGFLRSVNRISLFAGYLEGNNLKEIRATGRELYKKLIAPKGALIENKKQLLIIPDNVLNFLPFELLTDEDGGMLLNKHTLTYNYSCKILLKNGGNSVSLGESAFGMAPFAGYADNSDAAGRWNDLPASGREIQHLKGSVLLGKEATKKAFLQKAGRFNIIHLATHAVANDLHPDQSFIAFYPSTQDSDLAYKLYIPEVYNLQLDKTRLIILSACESGTGELAQGEGIISLSRAFSYSGCDNIITSMWKADDQSTAYISGKLYHYLSAGRTIAEALQQAKIDYINDPQISPPQKIPGYWAHLRLIGTFQKSADKSNWLWSIAAALSLVFILLITKKGRLKFRRPVIKQP